MRDYDGEPSTIQMRSHLLHCVGRNISLQLCIVAEVYFNVWFIRNYHSAVLDGIDLDIEGGLSKSYYSEFVTELRTLMDQDTSRTYLITGAPQCPYPDFYLGDGLL